MTHSFASLISVLALLAAPLTALPARANPYQDIARLELRPGWDQEDGRHIAAFELILQPGWKTYWRTPGDAGIPPVMDLSGSRNIKNAEIIWPTPVVFDQSGMTSVGYKGVMVLPLALTPEQPGQPIELSGHLQVGICKDVCVPVGFDFSQPLPRTATTDPKIAAAIATQAMSGKEAGLRDISCSVTPTDDGLSLSATLTLPASGADEFVVFETNDPLIWAAEARVSRKGDRLVAQTTLLHSSGDTGFALDRSALRLTVIGGPRAVDIQGCPAG